MKAARVNGRTFWGKAAVDEATAYIASITDELVTWTLAGHGADNDGTYYTFAGYTMVVFK
jgi:hypothetical protein